MLAYHVQPGADRPSPASRAAEEARSFGVMGTNEGLVTSFQEKARASRPVPTRRRGAGEHGDLCLNTNFLFESSSAMPMTRIQAMTNPQGHESL